MSERAGLDLSELVLSKPTEGIFQETEVLHFLDKFIDLVEELGWFSGGGFKPVKEGLALLQVVFKPEWADFTDEDVDHFSERLRELVGQCGYSISGSCKTVDINR